MPAQQSIVKKDNDVLCGRGGLSNNHPGNFVFRRIVSQNKDFYQACKKPSHKHFVVLSIISAIRRNGGRFIEQKKGVWQEIPTKKAMTKTSQALREQDNGSSPNKEGSSAAATTTTTKSKSKSKSKSSQAITKAKTTKKTKKVAFCIPPKVISRSVSNESAVCTTQGAKRADSLKSVLPVPESVSSNKRTKSSVPVSPTRRTDMGCLYQQCKQEDEYSANVIECEIERVLEDLLEDDEFGFQKKGCTSYGEQISSAPLCTSSAISYSAAAAICSDSEGEDNAEDDFDISPLGISENAHVDTFEYAEMCTDLATSLLSR